MKATMLLRSTAWLAAVWLAIGLLAGCGREQGDRAILYADGLGDDWRAPAGAAQLRIAVQNSFTRDAVVVCESSDRHYELTVGPIRERYMIIPDGKYEISAFSFGKSLGNTKLNVAEDNRNGAKGFRIQIRP